MQRTVRITLGIGCGLLAAQLALAQSASTTGQAQSQATADASTQPVQVNTSSTASGDVAAQVDARTTRAAIEKKAEKIAAQAKAKADAQLTAASEQVDKQASGDGEVAVATRLAAEFDMTTQALNDEKRSLDVSWGQLMIAHTLDANVSHDLTVEQLVAMHKDGMGWGEIAAGLGLQLGSVVSVVNSEGRVADGLAKADGHVATIRGEGARMGLGAGANAGLGVQAGKAAASAGVGLGVKVGH